jgi:hypothetical protein
MLVDCDFELNLVLTDRFLLKTTKKKYEQTSTQQQTNAKILQIDSKAYFVSFENEKYQFLENIDRKSNVNGSKRHKITDVHIKQITVG